MKTMNSLYSLTHSFEQLMLKQTLAKTSLQVENLHDCRRKCWTSIALESGGQMTHIMLAGGGLLRTSGRNVEAHTSTACAVYPRLFMDRTSAASGECSSPCCRWAKPITFSKQPQSAWHRDTQSRACLVVVTAGCCAHLLPPRTTATARESTNFLWEKKVVCLTKVP